MKIKKMILKKSFKINEGIGAIKSFSIFFILFYSPIKGKSFPIFYTDSLPKQIKLLKKTETAYPFILFDTYASRSSMSIATTGYASATRLVYRKLDESNLKDKQKKIAMLLAMSIQSLFGGWTHEEGHRSVLTTEDIGSISAPFFDKKGTAIVKGVRDSVLILLRDNKLPTYIRLHTGGLESDYLMVKQLRTTLAFGDDNIKFVQPEMILRNGTIIGYYFSSLFKFLEPNIKEKPNELENDIVGHDVYGAIKNLYRPTEKFYRYTNYENLSGTEKKYLKEVAWFSWFNLLSPSWAKFKLRDEGLLSFGSGFTMTPFGYMLEADAWIKWRHIKCLVSLQGGQNRIQQTGGFGVTFYDIGLSKNLRMDIGGNYFSQPKNLSFDSEELFSGGILDAQLKIKLPHSWKIPFEFHIASKLKTYGFVVGEPNFKQGLFLKLGGALIL